MASLTLASCATKPAEPIDASLSTLTSGTTPTLTVPSGGTPRVKPGTPDLSALAQSVADIENFDRSKMVSRQGSATSPTRRATTPTEIAPDANERTPSTAHSTRPSDSAVASMDLASMTNGASHTNDDTSPTTTPGVTQPGSNQPSPVLPGDAIGVAKALIVGMGAQPSPATALHVLGTLESMSPGFVQRLEDPTSDERHALTEDEVRTLRQARDLVLTNDQARVQASESLLNALGLPPSGPQFRVPKAELCTKVRSFGVYTPLPSTTFVAGYPARAIVYTEVAGFTARDLEGSNGLRRVELSQRLSLYSDADGLEVWKVRERSVTETARTPRTDFYLVQEIALPVNLSVGKYTLKLTVSDKNSGALAQASIPITIVADPSLAQRRR
ncbi:MAG: hypothetical protein AB7Q00_02125 [Phycisphaerales bacterium]